MSARLNAQLTAAAQAKTPLLLTTLPDGKTHKALIKQVRYGRVIYLDEQGVTRRILAEFIVSVG